MPSHPSTVFIAINMYIANLDNLRQMSTLIYAQLQIRRDKRKNLGIIFHITPLKHIL